MGKVKKWKLDFDKEFDNYFSKRRKLNNFLLQQQEEVDREILHMLVDSNESILLGRQEIKANGPNVEREQGKVWWRNVRANWSEAILWGLIF